MMILVTSPKGGVGVSAIVAELAQRLAVGGANVVAVDLTDQPALGYRVQENAGTGGGYAGGDPSHATAGFKQVDRAAARGSGRADFALAQRRPATTLVVDVSAGDFETRDALLPHADLVLCVLGVDAGSIAMLPRASRFQDVTPYCVLNQVDERRAFAVDAVTIVERLFGNRLIGVIRRDEAVNEALARLAPLEPGCAAANDLAALTLRVTDLLNARAAKAPIEDVA